MIRAICTKCPNTTQTIITFKVCNDGSLVLECLNCGDMKRMKPSDVPQEKAE